MADKRISELTSIVGDLTGVELVPIVQNGENYKASVKDFGTQPAFKLTPSGVITELGTIRTLSDIDNGKILYFTSNSPVQLNTADGLGVGFSCAIIQGGTGVITVTQSDGTTIASFGSLYKTSGQYAIATVISPLENVFYLSGQLS